MSHHEMNVRPTRRRTVTGVQDCTGVLCVYFVLGLYASMT